MVDAAGSPSEARWENYLAANGELGEARLRAAVSALLQELSRIHTSGRAHRRIAPDVLWFSQSGALDAERFGQAARDASSPQPRGELERFRAPEEWAGHCDAVSDCYSVGVLLFEAVTGRPVPDSANRPARLSLTASHFPEWSDEIISAINRALSISRDRRFQSAMEMSTALIRADALPVAAEPPSTSIASAHDGPGVVAAVRSADTAIRPLPNASVGRHYRQHLRELLGLAADVASEPDVDLPTSLGLTYDAEFDAIDGVPLQAGEFRVVLKGRLITNDGVVPLAHIWTLTVDPAPLSPWTNSPSEEDELFFKPDSAVASSVAGGLACFAASTRGRAHAEERKYREDDFAVHFVEPTGWHVLIVADGAASAEFSRRGSQIVCDSGVSAIRKCLERSNDLDHALAALGESATHATGLEQLEHAASNVFSQAACEAIVDLHRQASSGGALLSDFATTFIAVLAKRVGAGWMFASFSVGDGGAAVVVDSQTVVPLSPAAAGEAVNRATSITMLDLFKNPHDVGARTNVVFSDQFLFVALMTEAVSGSAAQTGGGPADAERWSALREQLGSVVDFRRPAEGTEQQLLGWLQFQSPGSHDDQTLILAFPADDGRR